MSDASPQTRTYEPHQPFGAWRHAKFGGAFINWLVADCSVDPDGLHDNHDVDDRGDSSGDNVNDDHHDGPDNSPDPGRHRGDCQDGDL